MKVLLLGGTSFIGPEIVRAFLKRGHDITVFTRSDLGSANFPSHAKIKRLKGNRQNPDDLKRVAAESNWDLVIDNLAYTGAEVKIALHAFTKVKRYFLTSTISVYRYARNGAPQPYMEDNIDFDHKPKDENLSDDHWQYARGKYDAEHQLRTNGKISWTIFRPSIVYGPFDNKARGFWYLARMRDGGPLLVGDGGMNSFRLAFAPALGELYALAAETPRSENKTYNVSQNEIVTLSDFLNESALTLGVKAELLSLPNSWMKGLGGPLAYNQNWISDGSLAKNELGFQHTPWKEFVATSARWFMDWKGDRAELVATRSQELKLAQRFFDLEKTWNS